MESTKVITFTFNPGSLAPQAFQVSCPFPVRHIETSTFGAFNMGVAPGLEQAVSNNIIVATSTLVENDVVGFISCSNNTTTTFQSHTCSHSFPSPRDIIGGTYYFQLDNGTDFKGKVFLTIKFKG